MKKTIIMIAALAAISFTPIVFAVQHKPVIKHHVVHVVKKHHKLDGHKVPTVNKANSHIPIKKHK